MAVDIGRLKEYLGFHCDIKYFEIVDSTNNAAKADEKQQEFSLFLAREQTKGRGRIDKHWISVKDKGLYFSIILKPRMDKVQGITVLMALAVYRALRAIDLEADIKWPNDILVKGKKICGILTQMNGDTIICGTGINVSHGEEDFSKLKNTATSLKLEKSPIDMTTLLADILNRFYTLYAEFLHNGLKNLINEYSDALIHNNCEVKLKMSNEDICGQFLGVDEDGGIILDVSGNVRTFICGEAGD